MNAYDPASARSAHRSRTLAWGTSAWLVLALITSAGAQSVDRRVAEAPKTPAARDQRGLRARARLERFAAYKLGRMAQQPEPTGEASGPLPPMTPMKSLDLRIPSLAELSKAAEAERVEIPDYASAVFAATPAITITEGGRRPWAPASFTWEASALCYEPLYFEDVNLERHGHSLGIVQPAASAGLALGQLFGLPYQMVAQPPCECIYTLGEERPGNCVPCQWQLPPLSLPAGAAEAGVVAGLILLIP
jgi:hypothetical protein